MKERLNLTIDGALLEAVKAYAARREMSVSELVECYFRSVTEPILKNNILEFMDRIEPPATNGGKASTKQRGEYGV